MLLTRRFYDMIIMALSAFASEISLKNVTFNNAQLWVLWERRMYYSASH